MWWSPPADHRAFYPHSVLATLTKRTRTRRKRTDPDRPYVSCGFPEETRHATGRPRRQR